MTKCVLSESTQEIANWREKLLKVLEINAGVITEIIPSLESIIGQQPEVIKLPPEQTKNRFSITFQNFIRVLAQPEHPLTIFLDDLQWADEASLAIIEQIYLRSDDKSLLLIAAYRDNETSPTHSLSSTLKQVEENGAIIHSVDLKPLRVEDLELMLVDALYTTKAETKSLAKLLEKKTQGNPYFVGEFLKELYVKGVFYFANGSWQWDTHQIEKLGFTDNIIELMVSKVEALPTDTKNLLTKAACIGSTFDLTTLATVTEKDEEEILLNLQAALIQDLLLKRKDLYTFAHDRVQQAAYALIPEDAKQSVHLEIGKHLLTATSEKGLDENIFSIVDQMNTGLVLITVQQEKDQLAELNLIAGKRAKASAAYQPALTYLKTALQLLGSDFWSRQYQLTLRIHEEAAEVADISEDYELVDFLFDAVNSNAKTPLDKVKVYITQMFVLTRQGKLQKAISNALAILKQLGFNLPTQPNRLQVMKATLKMCLILLGRNINQLSGLPTASNPKTIAVMNICDSLHPIFGVSEVKNFPLWLIVIQKQIAMQLKYGNHSPVSYAAFALVLILKNRIKIGHQFSKLALDLDLQFQRNDEAHYNINHVVYGLLAPSQAHIAQAISKLEQNYSSAIQNGYINAAAGSLGLGFFYRFFIGESLSRLEHDLQLVNTPTQLGLNSFCENEFFRSFRNVTLQVAFNLQYLPDNPSLLRGKFFDEDQENLLRGQPSNFLSLLIIFKLMLTYTFGEYHQGIALVKTFEKFIERFPAPVPLAVGNFYSSLTRLAFSEGNRSLKFLFEVSKTQKRMRNWVKYAPMNYLHKWHLIEAERYRVLGKDTRAWHHYKEAIKGARAQNYVNDEALALELTAKFFLKKDDEKLAGHYMRESYGAYTRWGAVAKLKQLEEKYPQLLVEPFSLKVGLAANKINNYHESTRTAHSKLDISSLMQASQALSSELKLNTLLANLMKTLLENAGAQQGLLLLPKGKNNTWTIVARCKVDEETELEEVPLENAEEYLPISLIRFVIHAQEQVVLSDASQSENYRQDAYMKQNQPKSVIALPLMHQGKLVGVVYLENSLAAGVFSKDRVEVLTLLSTQAAISLQNALLLTEVQEKITQLELSRQRLVQNDEKQRRDLAEHLHSRVQSKLLAAWTKLESHIAELPTEESRQEMEEVCGVLEQIQEQDLSQVGYLLHPTIVKLGLIPAIESLLDDLDSTFKVQWQYDEKTFVLDDPKNNQIAEELRLTIYRITEEALLNIKKHAKASLVKISLTCKGQDLFLEISDDGCGFEQSEMQPHLGLHSIDDRVSLARGSWEITGKSNQGTVLRVQLPVP